MLKFILVAGAMQFYEDCPYPSPIEAKLFRGDPAVSDFVYHEEHEGHEG